MDVRIAVAESLWEELCVALNDEVETAGVILAGQAAEGDRLTLCLNRVIWVPEEAYDLRAPDELRIKSEGWMPALAEAAMGGWQPIFFHTHPSAGPRRSSLDDEVDEELALVFKTRLGRVYASLIVSGPAQNPGFTGTFDGRSITQIRVVGDRLRLLQAGDSVGAGDPALEPFDRQIRAFGRGGQALLRRLRVGVAGGGGTGSAVYEQLLRLGVGSIVVIDDDVITDTNLTRIHESELADVGEPKAEVLAARAERIGLGSDVTPVVAKVTQRGALAALRGCDIVFGCTDDNAGRAILSRLAYYYCLPVIDVGVVITAQGGQITGLDARLTVMMPGTPCLFCRGRVDANRMREEMQRPEELKQLVAEGYAQGLAERDPSVVTYTTMIASFAVDVMLQRLFGFGDGQPSSELLLRVPQREIRRLAGAPQQGCFCADRKLVGRGDREPPLDRMWP
jgi:molybdopterin/thiamine biosynthesis adenylyltransferase